MTNFIAAAVDTSASLHDLTEHTSALSFFYIIIGALLSIIVWFTIRDRVGIKETLDKLVDVVSALRLDLSENYAKKLDVEKLSHKIDTLNQHMVVRLKEDVE